MHRNHLCGSREVPCLPLPMKALAASGSPRTRTDDDWTREVGQLRSWPGNVRQLENTVARMVALGTGNEIGPEGSSRAANEPRAEPVPEGMLSLPEQVETLERSLIAKTLKAVSGNQSEAARRLGLGRGALIERLKKYGLLSSREQVTTLRLGATG